MAATFYAQVPTRWNFRLSWQRPGRLTRQKSRETCHRWLLPSVAAATVLAAAGDNDWALHDAVMTSCIFLAVVAVAMAVIEFRLHDARLRECALAMVALAHTLTYGSLGAFASETLIMFWVVALPLAGGTELLAPGIYLASLLIGNVFLGDLTFGRWAAACCLLIPVEAAQAHYASLWEELLQRRRSVKLLTSGTGGARCQVDLDTGRVLYASGDLLDLLGEPNPLGRHLCELMKHSADKQSTVDFLRRSAMCSGAASYAVELERCAGREKPMSEPECNGEADLLEPVEVTSLQCGLLPGGIIARIIPYNLCQRDATLDVLVQVLHESVDEELLTREQEVKLREAALKDHEQNIKSKENSCAEIEYWLQQMHDMYAESCNLQAHPAGHSGGQERREERDHDEEKGSIYSSKPSSSFDHTAAPPARAVMAKGLPRRPTLEEPQPSSRKPSSSSSTSHFPPARQAAGSESEYSPKRRLVY